METLEYYNIEIFFSKTKIMVVSNKNLKTNVEVRNEKPQQVVQMKYLGGITNSIGGHEAKSSMG